jgi:arylsulfatase A-like enzyme
LTVSLAVCLCEAAHGQGGNSSTCERVHHGNDYATDYYTDLLANDTLEWIQNVTASNPTDPFLAVIHTPAPHVPNVCAPQYCDLFNDTTAPRVASWNKAPSMDKHWLMRQIQPMNKYTQSYVSDGTYVDRWRTLQSVDELVVRLVAELEAIGRLDDTYIVFSSDHGQHLGEFGENYPPADHGAGAGANSALPISHCLPAEYALPIRRLRTAYQAIALRLSAACCAC